MTFILEKYGFEVAQARDGREGIDLAGRIDPDLIILDIQLPVMDGHAVARELKADSALADVPVLAVTSYAMTGDRERILASGCTGYMEKPIDPETFAQEIARFVPARAPGQGDDK
jgi:CheY-like chemotaxis protein